MGYLVLVLVLEVSTTYDDLHTTLVLHILSNSNIIHAYRTHNYLGRLSRLAT